jgi:hypothetical protein
MEARTMIGIEVEDGRTACHPLERLEGTLSWSLASPAKAIEVRLIWHTSGKGDRDVAIVDRLRLANPPAAESRRPFRFQLPAGPWSFSGSLITLAWALEAVVLPSNESARLDLVVSPTGEEIRLGRVEP